MNDRRPKPRYVKLPSRDGWVVTFADMVSLLLTVFVMLFSMTTIEADSLQQMFGRLRDDQVSTLPVKPSRVYNDLAELRLALEQALAAPKPAVGREPFGVQESVRGFAINLSADALFASGSASLKPAAAPLLDAVALALRDSDAQVAVEGHSDSLGASEANWRLSMARAGAVLDYLVYHGALSPTRLALAGYGPTRPVASNADAAGRSRNRRVEIILLKDRF